MKLFTREKLINPLIHFFYPQKEWIQIEYFDEAWQNRIKTMASYIPGNAIVMDLGCGKCWLKSFLKPGSVYIPVDYLKRTDETIVCDFNKHEFPEIESDVIFISGCFEYVRDYKWFAKMICLKTHMCIISYCTTDFVSDIRGRKKLAWVNHLAGKELTDLFKQNNFKLVHTDYSIKNNVIFIFQS